MRQNAAQAMRAMHDHIAMTFPDLCPMHGPGHMGEPPSHARPVPAGVGGPVPHGASKAAEVREPLVDMAALKTAVKAEKKARRQRDREAMAAVFKGDLAGINTLRAEHGLAPLEEVAGAVHKTATAALPPVEQAPQAAPDLEAIIAKATQPLLARLDEQQKMLHAIADQPDPAVTAYRGPAIAKTTAAPAGPAGIAERAALAQDNLVRELYATAKNSPDPQLRAEAWDHLISLHGLGATVRT
jgi:hypothetical protein